MRSNRQKIALGLFVAFLVLSIFIPALPVAADAPGLSLTADEMPSQMAKSHAKMDSTLASMAAKTGDLGTGQALEQAVEKDLPVVGDTVQVVVKAENLDAAAVTVQTHGGEVQSRHSDLLQAVIPVKALERLADEEAIDYLRRPLPATTTGAPSEGVHITRAVDWHAQSHGGDGVKVAILDLGFAGYQGLLGSDLPAAVTAQSFRADGDITGGGEAHGTGCAELVYDMAPNAELYLVNFGTELEFADAVDWLIAQNVRVISCSIGWVNAGPYDGTGFICDIVEGAHEAGVLWVNSIGNQAQRHWEGQFVGGGDEIHDFAPGSEINTVNVSAGEQISVFLSWDDWHAVEEDYDLYLYRQVGQSWWRVAWSNAVQSGEAGQSPTEAIVVTVPWGGVYGVVIHQYRADRDVDLELYSFTHDFDLQVPDSSLLIPADAESALSVGAFRWNTGALEAFSGHGPTNDGRPKPELLGPDHVTTETYGPMGFGGTSPAAPHTAGAAALVMGAFPNWTSQEVVNYLETQAVDTPSQLALATMSGASLAGLNDTGSGNLNLGDSPGTPTAVALADAWLEPGQGGVMIRWQTGSEINNLGFNIYRSRSDDPATAIKVNEQLIPSRAFGSVVGASYTYLDERAKSGVRYHYWLEDVEATGGVEGSDLFLVGLHYAGRGRWSRPEPRRVIPANGGAAARDSVRFVGVYRDWDADLSKAYLLLNDAPKMAGGILVRYDHQASTFAIYDEEQGAWSEDLTAHQPKSIRARLATLRGLKTWVKVRKGGKVVRVIWRIRLLKPARGSYNIYQMVEDAAGNAAGWTQMGTFEVR